MGYGTRALSLLKDYYELRVTSLDEEVLAVNQIESVPDEEIGLLEETIGISETFQTWTNNAYIKSSIIWFCLAIIRWHEYFTK